VADPEVDLQGAIGPVVDFCARRLSGLFVELSLGDEFLTPETKWARSGCGHRTGEFVAMTRTQWLMVD
jgi:hypothetical protein